MRKASLLAVLGILTCFVPSAALASHGWVPVRADDGVSSHCIDRAKEAVTLDVRRLVVNKEVGWFTEDAKVDLLLGLTLSGSTTGKGDGKSLTLPRAYSATLRGGKEGWYSAGIEERVLDTYALRNLPDQITSAHVDISIVNERGTTVLSDIATTLLSITKQLPIPSGPFSEALGYADKYANGILTKVTSNGDVAKDQVKTGSIQLGFGQSSASCDNGNSEKTGTVALVELVDHPAADKGYPDLEQSPDGYCFRAVARPTFSVEYQPKPQNGICPAAGSAAGWISLKSPHVAFVLSADQIESPPPQGNVRGIAVVARSAETVARCRATGWKHCP